MDKDDCASIGYHIHMVQESWPLGKPLVDSLGSGLWEVRIKLTKNIARVIFCFSNEKMVLLHGFIKKKQKTPDQEIDLALKRRNIYQAGEKL